MEPRTTGFLCGGLNTQTEEPRMYKMSSRAPCSASPAPALPSDIAQSELEVVAMQQPTGSTEVGLRRSRIWKTGKTG
eukprot:245719-Hanusia_phi.AAC.2